MWKNNLKKIISGRIFLLAWMIAGIMAAGIIPSEISYAEEDIAVVYEDEEDEIEVPDWDSLSDDDWLDAAVEYWDGKISFDDPSPAYYAEDFDQMTDEDLEFIREFMSDYLDIETYASEYDYDEEQLNYDLVCMYENVIVIENGYNITPGGAAFYLHEVCDDYDIEYLKSMNWCEILEHYEYEWMIAHETESEKPDNSNITVMNSNTFAEWLDGAEAGDTVLIQGASVTTVYSNCLWVTMWGASSDSYSTSFYIYMLDTTNCHVGGTLSTTEVEFMYFSDMYYDVNGGKLVPIFSTYGGTY